MKLHELTPAPGSIKTRKRIGRGIGSGLGKTSARGHKGQNSRSGGGVRQGFEGGQMPYQQRLPKRGFTNIFKQKIAIVNLNKLNIFEANSIVDLNKLKEKKLIRKNQKLVKILGTGELTKQLTIKANSFSKSASEKIKAIGGIIEVI